MENKCLCGCGRSVNLGRKFVRGHNRKIFNENLNKKIGETLLRKYKDPEFAENMRIKKRFRRKKKFRIENLFTSIKNFWQEFKFKLFNTFRIHF